MQRRKQELEELKDQVRKRGKKFVSYKEGADLYSLGLHTFEKLAKDANAIYRVKGRMLINIEIIEEYMETFHEFNEGRCLNDQA